MAREDYRRLVHENRILLVRTGSHLYGTATAASDEDRQGIFIPPEDHVLGLKQIEHVDLSVDATDEKGRNLSDAVDVTYVSLRAFVRQALKNNPNVLEPLFATGEHLLFVNDLGRELLDARHLFPSQMLAQRYAGYARGQRRKLTNGSEDEPERMFKRASHLIRLLKEGIELLETGALRFPLEYAGLIRAVKDGEWTLEKVLRLSRMLEEELEQARESSSLPAEPRFQAINTLTVRLVKMHLGRTET